MLRLLGQPGHAGFGLFPRRGYEIVAVAALCPFHRTTRSALAALLWGDLAPERAFGNLRYAIAAIRRWEGENRSLVIDADSHEVTAVGHSDLDRLLSFNAKGEASATALQDLFAGELLAGHQGAHQEFETWLAEQRGRVDAILLELALTCSGAPADVDAVLELALAKSPFDERVIKAKVSNLLADHRVADAKAAIASFSRRLHSELGAVFSDGTRTWLNQVLPEPVPGQAIYRESVRASVGSLPKVLVLHPRQTQTSTGHRVVARAVVNEMTLALCQLRTFAMFSPHTARQIEPEDGALQASSYGADYLVRTEIMGGSRLAFSLQHLETHQILFADTVCLDSAETAASEMGQALAASVAQQIASAETYEYRATGAASAYMHYLLGCERLRYDLPAIRKARKHFVRALELFPYFAPAKAMLARTLNMEWLVLARPESDLLHQAMDIAKEAATIDPLAPSGHWEVGHSLLYLQRIDESFDHIERARNRAPHLADLLADEADVLVHLGNGDEAQKRIGLALKLNPLAPDEYFWVQGSAEFISGDYRGALRSLGRMVDSSPVARLMAASAAMIGELDLAREYREVWLERYPNFRVADWVKIVPVKKAEVVERMTEAMRRAGFK